MINLVPHLLAFTQSSSEQTPEGSLFFPPKASNFAAESDWLYNFIFWVSTIAFALTIIATVYFVVRYRKSVSPEPQPSPTHSTKLEVIWSVIPSIFLVVMFWKGFELFVDYRKVPPGAYQIRVEGMKWDWTFSYPSGAETKVLHVPMGEPVELLISSKDVLHSVFIPAFRVKQDAVPGRYTKLWFEATMPGTFTMTCTEYCGTYHWNMAKEVKVYETREEFNRALAEASDPYKGLEPVAAGEVALAFRGCTACHANDQDGIGPKLGELFGSERELADGSTVTADENYIRESIMQPQAKTVKGFAENGMPATIADSLSDEELENIILYIRSLKAN